MYSLPTEQGLPIAANISGYVIAHDPTLAGYSRVGVKIRLLYENPLVGFYSPVFMTKPAKDTKDRIFFNAEPKDE